MKKLIFFAAIAATVLASCAKNNVFQKEAAQTPVSFGVYAGKTADTKATYGDITTANLATSEDGFSVFAFYTGETEWSSSGTTPNFMYNQQVRAIGSYAVAPTDYSAAKYPTGWYYNPIKYWPNGQNSTAYEAAATSADKLSFFAYAPHTAVTPGTGVVPSPYPGAGEGIISVTSNTNEGEPKVTFVVPAASDKQIDLLWATPIKNQTKKELDQRVSFTFNHALTKLKYQVQAVVDAASPTTSNLQTETKIILQELQVTANGKKKGTLNLDNGVWSLAEPAENSVITYDNTNGFSATTTVHEKTGFNVTETAADLNASKSPMIIPGTIAAGDLKVQANYWVITEDAKLALGYSAVQNIIYATNAAPVTFDAGKAYTIVVRLGLNSVDFNVTEVTAWDPIDGTHVDLPQNAE